MNKLIVLTSLIETVILGAEPKPAPNYITQVGHGSIQWTIYSDTDLSSNSSKLALKKLVFTGKDHTLDLRAVEEKIIKPYKKSLHNQEQPKRVDPWYSHHRGKLCFCAGASMTFISFLYAFQLSMFEKVAQ